MYCKNCGKKLDKSESYCKNCGQCKDKPVENNVMVNKNKYSKLSFGFGIGCLVASFFISVLCIPFGIVSIIYYIKGKKENETSLSGLGFSIAGIIIGIVTLLLWIFFVMIIIDVMEEESYKNKVNRNIYQYKYDLEDEINTGELKRISMAEWLVLSSSNKKIVTVLTINNETSAEYLEEVEEVAEALETDIYYFNFESLSNSEKLMLENLYPNIKNNNTYPYTFVTQNNKIVADLKGYVSETDLMNKLISVGINDKTTY